ncbi:lamin tail domain-containing protein [Salinispora mooreana]|uniref:lamin tail domain-containing protein n=1 Tax=Salinispora mooreana TaxID=999545 RepID=UPI00035C1A03|nr:lamin tail domain-containing protein [Salinispora mooreana]
MRPRRALAIFAIVTATASIAAVGVTPNAATAAPTDLFISEYVEGSSNNKAIELFNGTGAPVDLATGGYRLLLYFNGSTTPTTLALTGTVAAGDVFVFAHSSANAAILAQADQVTGAGLFNGDDAVVLRRDSTVLDVIGQVGVDPGSGWGTGLTSTANHTLRRLSSVASGDTDPGDSFEPAAEWAGFDTDTVDGLGAHHLGDGPVDIPATITCGDPLVTPAGTAASREVTATDPDDEIVDLAVTSVSPTPATGTISRTAFTPAGAVGDTARATVSASADLDAGAYSVVLTATDTDGTTATCTLPVQAARELTVGEVQGPTTDAEEGGTDRSPLAPASGNGASSARYAVRGVVTQRTLARDSAGRDQHGFFLQSRADATDGDPASSDGIFVFMGSNTSLIGGYVPTVGDEVVLQARVSEYYHMTQLSSASLVRRISTGLDVDQVVAVTDAVPPADLADAERFWERHEGARMRVRADSQTVSGRTVFASSADAETWLVDRDDPLVDRSDPDTRRVFRDAHPLDNDPTQIFDDGNGQRIMLGSLGVKAASGDNTTLLPPARTFDTLTADAVGGLYYSFQKYGVQVESAVFAAGTDPATNHPPQPAQRSTEYAVAAYNVENLYDFRDDPFDGCDFAGNDGCTGVRPPFDYVPGSEQEYRDQLAALADQITNDLHSPDLILVQETEDQDICVVDGGTLVCGDTDDADGAPDSLQELALTIADNGGPAYAAAHDRSGADARGITSAFLYRTDRVALAEATADDPLLGAAPTVQYRAPGLPSNADVQNPKALNAVLPPDVDTSTGRDGDNVFTRAPQLGRFTIAAAPGSEERLTLWAASNHYSSGPDRRVGQRREQAAYGAAIVSAVTAADPDARVVFGGDLNVFPRPDDPIATAADPTPSDQLAPLYEMGLRNLWDDLLADAPSSAYSYSFAGQAQTLDHLFVTAALHDDLVRMRAAHINADWPAEYAGDGSRGASDHDPQVARFRSRPTLTVADASVVEGDRGSSELAFTVSVSRPRSDPTLVCALTLGRSARPGVDYRSYAGCQTLQAGHTTLTFPVSVRGDRKRETDERLTLLVVGSPGVQIADRFGTGTIVNDD